MSQKPGLALVICAPSGAGKTTLVHRLMKEYHSFSFSVSCTTREAREGEVQGKDYDFVSLDEFKKRRDAGYFAEWAEVHDNFYGSPLGSINELLSGGRDLLFDIDVQGAKQLKKALNSACFIFILPPSQEELKRRLELRGTEDELSLQRRLGNARKEIGNAQFFDYLIINDDLDRAYGKLESAYIAAGLSYRANKDFLKELLEDWS